MKNVYLLTTLILLISIKGYSQTPITVAESTLKVGGMGEEVFYYGFAEGDKLIFQFEEVNGKEIKEIEIIELPGSSKFMDYKAKRIENKSVEVTRTGVYKFRFANSAVSGRICRFKIQRIPSSELTKNFNSNVYWRTVTDTTYWMENEKYLVSRDTLVIPVITNQVERVHSQTSMNGKSNKSIVQINLPNNTVSWSYYLGVGKSSEEIFKQAEEKAQRTRTQLNAVASLTSQVASLDPTGSSALAALALKGWAQFGVPNNADNIQYWFINDYQNAQLFMGGNQFYLFDKGNGPLCYKRMTNPTKGTFYLGLLNDNLRDGIDVYLRVTAVTVNEKWGIRQVRKYKTKSRKESYLKS